MFSYDTVVRLHDTDAAGVVYFASAVRMAHEAYEAFLDKVGFRLPRLLRSGDLALPIVHVEADYVAPMLLGDALAVEVVVDQVGKTSFGIRYRILKDDRVCAVVQTVHVAIDPKTRKKRNLPPKLRAALAAT